MKATISHIEYSPSKEVTFVRCKPEKPFVFKEGQFMMIETNFPHHALGKPLKKPYSIATTHYELETDGTIGFIVKKIRDDYMSEYLTEKVRVGDTVHLFGPAGHMTLTTQSSGYFLISIGSGLSPMIGLYNAIRKESTNVKIVMLYGERYMSQVLPSTYELLQKDDVNTKHILYLSKESEIAGDEYLPDHYRNGRIDQGIPDGLQFLDGIAYNAYLCGKPEMVEHVKSLLSKNDHAPQHIYFEKY